ncbi:MAG: ribosome recycling factor [Catonella sp.]|jgi:ribosome recycling factor|nr:ribosome recycling factor [Catonella sp.]MDY6356738.1 ribosome recycling factor [Catonella sp.]
MSAATKDYEDKMKKTIDNLAEQFVTVRAGRANPHILDKIRVDYYGQPSPLQSVANVSVPEPRIIQIQPWEPSLIKAIEKEINAANLGIAPNNDGKVIRLVFPELTEERRKELTKDIKKMAESAKVAIRNIRRDALDAFKKQQKADEITEDDMKDLENEMQKLTDKYVGEIESMTDNKSKELMTV